jgi:hypothetical protein
MASCPTGRGRPEKARRFPARGDRAGRRPTALWRGKEKFERDYMIKVAEGQLFMERLTSRTRNGIL